MKPVFTIVFILCILVCISIYYSYSTCKSDPTPTPTPDPVLKPVGYKIDRVKDQAVCVRVNEAPNSKNGVYSNLLACEDALHGLDPKPVGPKPVDPSRPFGVKIERVKNQDVCVLVNEAPNEKNGVYSNFLACYEDIHGLIPKPVDPSIPFGFKIERVKNQDVCVLVNEAPNEKNGVYSNFLTCYEAIHGLDPKPVGPKPVDPSRPFGFKIDRVKDQFVCVRVNETPNAKNGVYSNLLACDDALHGLDPNPVGPKPVDPSRPFGFKIDRVKDQSVCIRVNEAPNEKNGVYSNLLACEDALHGLDPKPVGPKPVTGSFGYQFTGKDCSRVSEAPNAKNGVYADMMDCYKETISMCDCKKK
jgi:hypothetical protein